MWFVRKSTLDIAVARAVQQGESDLRVQREKFENSVIELRQRYEGSVRALARANESKEMYRKRIVASLQHIREWDRNQNTTTLIEFLEGLYDKQLAESDTIPDLRHI